MRVFESLVVACVLALSSQFKLHAQGHGHLNIGALGVNQDDPLAFINGADFATDTSYVKTLIHTNGGRFAGYFHGNYTLTALPASAEHAGPDPAAPALGAFIRFRITCLEAPPDGQFGFWDSDSVSPSETLSAGQTGTNLWAVSESDGSPGSDPYGHIHGRRFSATKPGTYKVALQAFDTSTNGPNGGPMHSPSAWLVVTFQAGVLVSIEPDGNQTRIRYVAPVGSVWQLENSSSLGTDAAWSPKGEPVIGDDYRVFLTEANGAEGPRFYRLRRIAP